MMRCNISQLAGSIWLLVAAVFLVSCAEKSSSTLSGQPAFYRNLEAPTAQLDLRDAATIISSYRANKGLGAVVIDPELVTLAQNHAIAQARANKVGHTVGGSFSSRIRKLENARSVSVENISAGYRSFAEAFSGWRESKRHNANLLNKKVTRLGIAKSVNASSKYKVFWTLIMTGEPVN